MSRRRAPWTTFRVLRGLMQFVRPYLGEMALAIVLNFVTIGASVGLMATSGLLIAKAALHPSTILLIWVPIVGVRFFALARASSRYGERYVSHDLTFRMLKEMRVWLYQRLEPLVPQLWQDRHSADATSALMSDVDTLQNFYLRAVGPPVTAVLITVLAAVLFAHFGWSMGIAVVIGLTLVGTGVPVLTHALARRSGARMVQARTAVQTHLTDTVEGLAEVVGFGREEDMLAQIDAHQEGWMKAQHWLAHVDGLRNGLLLTLSTLTMWIVLWLGMGKVHGGKMEWVYLAMLVQAALAVFEAATPLSLAWQQLGECVESGRSIFSLTEHTCPVSVPREPQTPSSPVLEVDDLSFRYPQSHRWVLRHLSFHLQPGRKIAVVGASGSGKSTLIRLLLRFWDQTEGVIRLGGIDLRSLHPDTVREQFAVIEQDAHLFHQSVADNLRIGQPGAGIERLREAARQAQIDSMLTELPNGYETLAGEFGARFSGGERQRLVLARALLRKAPFLLLDEPTAGLDAVTEARFMDVLLNAAPQEQAILLITHRLVHLHRFDEILVMQSGVVVERGPHAELLQQRGLYRAMWEIEQDRLDTELPPSAISPASAQ